MSIRVEPFHVWLRRFPRDSRELIRIDLYAYGSVSEVDVSDWRFVRLMSGRAAKLGVVAAADVPDVFEGELLWLRTSNRLIGYEFFMRTTSGGGGQVRNVIRYYTHMTTGAPSTSQLPEGLPAHNEPGANRSPRKHFNRDAL